MESQTTVNEATGAEKPESECAAVDRFVRRPMLFSSPMIRAIVSRRKFQTRRVVNFVRGFGGVTQFGRSNTPGYDWHFRDCRKRWNDLRDSELIESSPYGKPGDLLWVREAFSAWFGGVHWSECEPSRRTEKNVSNVFYRATHNFPDDDQKWIPSIHMPRWASRLQLRVRETRIEKLQQISESDAEAEGVDAIPDAPAALTHRTSFARLWDKLNASRGYSWESNPWVWVVTFEVW